jgi:hypothetical protein
MKFRYDNMPPEQGSFLSTLPLQRSKKTPVFVHVLLFIATFASAMMAGTAWIGQNPLEITNWLYGFTYAALLMAFLTAHEFGHYIAARIHKVDATLPYFIPLPIPFASMFGTLGAYIRTRGMIPNRKALFDIGVAGPIAGFIVCLAILIIGLITLPSAEYLYSIHPEYRVYGTQIPEWGIYFGDTLLLPFLAKIFAPQGAFLPPLNEIYHYPFLCVGWFGMFVTSLNLLPMGQLDGGHIIYAMFGEQQRRISRIAWWLMLSLGLGSFLGWFYEQIVVESPNEIYTAIQMMVVPGLLWLKMHAGWVYNGWSGWIFWAIITRFFMKLNHPEIKGENLGIGRMLVGWAAIIIFILTFAFNGIYEIPRTEPVQFRLEEQKKKSEPIISLPPLLQDTKG